MQSIRNYQIEIKKDEDQAKTLLNLITTLNFSQYKIFCNSKESVFQVAETLKDKDLPYGFAHSEMESEERDEVFNKYRRGEIKIVVTCDYYKKQYALNKDFCIINYELPDSSGNSKYTLSGYYTLRIKSSGSLGNKGLVVNFITEDNRENMEQIKESFSKEHEEKFEIKDMPEDLNLINLEMKLSKYKSMSANMKKTASGPTGFDKSRDFTDKPWLKKKLNSY